MARPKKQEVDYFPHYCDHGKVLFILENHFKNDGYAVFYKLEELLSKTEGHCYDCSRLESWEYLLSRMGTTEEIVTGVIEKLSAMAIIDAPLWKEKRIWMQSFTDSISDVYARRKVDLPTKPELLPPLIPLSGINANNNPQSKVKESKVKESKREGLKHKKLNDEEWLESLKSNPAYANLDILKIKGKCEAWCMNNGKELTRARLLNWLNREDKPLTPGGNGNAGTYPHKTDGKRTPLQDDIDRECAKINAKWEQSKKDMAAAHNAGGNAP